MKQPLPPSSPSAPAAATAAASATAGFSLVEVLVAAVLLVVGATVALALFTAADQLFSRGRSTDADQLAVNADLAEIQKRNRRFVCSAGSSCALVASSSSDPNEDQYTPLHPGVYPPGASFDAMQLAFTGKEATSTTPAVVGLCSSYDAVKYPTMTPGSPSGLIQQFKLIALDTLPAMANGITRTVSITAPASETPPTPHTYVVTYSKGIQVLRRVRLVPTVAGWCP